MLGVVESLLIFRNTINPYIFSQILNELPVQNGETCFKMKITQMITKRIRNVFESYLIC